MAGSRTERSDTVTTAKTNQTGRLRQMSQQVKSILNEAKSALHLDS